MYKQVIELLNVCKKRFLGDTSKQFDLAIQACKKQIEKQVDNRKVLRDLNDKPYSIKGDCPVCGCLDMQSTVTNYCFECGQKLDWDDNL